MVEDDKNEGGRAGEGVGRKGRGGGEREGEGMRRGMGIDMVGKGREREGQVGLEPLAPG